MEGNAWVIQVSVEVNTMSNFPAGMNRWRRRSIYKLPASVTDLHRTAYKPQVVSFGPYHYKDECLKPMEEHKDRALFHFLKRSKVPFQCYYRSLAKISPQLMEAYDSLDPALQQDTDAFLKIMIRDGCFMIETLRASSQSIEGYSSDDPVFSDHGRLCVMPHIKRDMFMLENQLPILVLHILLAVENEFAKEQEESACTDEDREFTCTTGDEGITNKLIFKFFFPDDDPEISKVPSNCLHILDFYRKCLLRSTIETTHKRIDNMMISHCCDDIIGSAVELEESGINIIRSKRRSLRDITFEKGVLSLPMLVVDDLFEPLYLNIIAFERFHVGAGNDVTAYIFFMDNIIDNERDVNLLHRKDIIQNAIGSNKAAAKLINSMSKDVTLDRNSSLGSVYRNVNEYCRKRWPRYRANLKRTYFTSPWASISVLAAFVLFALATIQTAYAIMEKKELKPHSRP